MLASGSRDNTFKLWDVASGEELGTTPASNTTFGLSVAFSPDGQTLQTLASGYDDDTIDRWDVGTREKLRTLKLRTFNELHARDVLYRIDELNMLVSRNDPRAYLSISFSPDGQTVASGSWDNTFKLWDVASGRELRTFIGHGNTVTSIAFSPDGQVLASGSDDGTVIIWSITDGTIQARFIAMGTVGSITLDGNGVPISVTGNEDAIYHFVKDGKVITISEMRAMGYNLPTLSGA